MKDFEFGKNWVSYCTNALSNDRVSVARKEFNELFTGIPLQGKKFLDIGFGQGLSLFFAAESGAEVTGCDKDLECRKALNRTAEFFDGKATFPIVIGSILSSETVGRLRGFTDGAFDIVHAWGVLHHTGEMFRAIDNACDLIAANGYFIVAIYNKHWSSPLWNVMKRIYCQSPKIMQHLLIAAFLPVIFFAKLLITGRNPLRQQRGMDFYFNSIDWVGGYPYEYASVGEIRSFVERKGFTCVRTIPAEVPTGCNQFIFKKITGNS
jgi:SAM-dependent methyltransferase